MDDDREDTFPLSVADLPKRDNTVVLNLGGFSGFDRRGEGNSQITNTRGYQGRHRSKQREIRS